MDLFAFLFGFALFVVSLVVTYQWGIKPDRELKRRRAEMALADMRRRQPGPLRPTAARRPTINDTA